MNTLTFNQTKPLPTQYLRIGSLPELATQTAAIPLASENQNGDFCLCIASLVTKLRFFSQQLNVTAGWLSYYVASVASKR